MNALPVQAFDEYGFPLDLTPQQAKARQECIAAQRKQEDKWQKYAKAGQLPPMEKLKKLCRKIIAAMDGCTKNHLCSREARLSWGPLPLQGVPPKHRAWVWSEVSGAAAKQKEQMNNYYEAMVHMGEACSIASHQIELTSPGIEALAGACWWCLCTRNALLCVQDLPRTFPHNSWVAGGDGKSALRRVLLAFSVHKPEVGYCQSMNYVAAMLLLGMDLDEEKAFWAMVALIDDNGGPSTKRACIDESLIGTLLPAVARWPSKASSAAGILYHDMYAANLVGTHVEMRSLEELLSKKQPRLYKHLQALSCDMSIIATDCTGALQTTARVWDALLNEGPKILFRVGLALMRIHEESLLAQDNPGTLLREMRRAAQAMHDREKLMKMAFDGLGSMPMARIDNYRQIKQEVVDDEMRKRANRHNLNQALSQHPESAKVLQTEGF
eukprot:jgi/Astpho2/5166/Aster-04750